MSGEIMKDLGSEEKRRVTRGCEGPSLRIAPGNVVKNSNTNQRILLLALGSIVIRECGELR